MCGIFGIAGGRTDQRRLEASTSLLTHRGPDDFGYYTDDRVALGHRRLSIIDLTAGRQPIFTEDGRKCVIFNGEIYNFQELADLLKQKGHIFTTGSDTEVILHAYEEWGKDCVSHLRGMFAFAIWDIDKRLLFLARDRLGIKPLFYAHFEDRFYFSSEIKAILADPAVSRDMDESALACYFSLSYIPAPLTIYRAIRKLLPGHTLIWENGKISIRKYWDLDYTPDHSRTEKDLIGELMSLMRETIGSHLMSDVPLGAFLSGGVDSSTSVALMAEFSKDPVKTFCIGFGGNTGGYLDERRYARLVADRYGSTHREYEVRPDPEEMLDETVRGFDEPFADDSTIPSYYICREARRDVAVALSGLGGDEAFGGYERYLGLKARQIYEKLPLFLSQRIIRPFFDHLPETPGGHYTVNHIKRFARAFSGHASLSYYGYLTILPPGIVEGFFADSHRFSRHLGHCRDLICDYFESISVHNGDPLGRALYCDAKTYLPEDILAVTDRMSMRHSLEVRVPFLDHRLFEFCASIPSELKLKWFRKKYVLRKATRDLLPRAIFAHRKQGFVGPMTTWLKGDLKDYAVEALSKRNLSRHGLLNEKTIERILQEHFSGKEIHDTLIWSILVFQRWFEAYAS